MPKIVYPENIQKLKEQLETGNNLVDYFFVCGVSPSICTNELLYKITSDEIDSEEMKQILKPTILCKFPEFDKTYDLVDDAIISYCFPDGFNLEYNSSSYPNRKIFSIILDNNILSPENPQKYLTCILFYEKLYQYKKLQQVIENIENNKEYEEKDNINNMRDKLEEEKNMNIYRHKKMPTLALPQMNMKQSMQINEKIITNMILDNNKEINKNKENQNQPLNKLKYYYIPKCICLLSVHPHIKLYQKILNNIYEYGLSQNNEIPLEKIITNLIIEVPIPPRGLYSITYDYNFDFNEKNKIISKIKGVPSGNNNKINNNIEYGRATTQFIKNNNNILVEEDENKILPLKSIENDKILVTEIDLNKFNKNLSFNCIMETIKHILLNSKIIFFSQNLTLLIDTISVFLKLIFPFKYPFQVSSFLQKGTYGVLGTPSPFIFGIREEFNEDFFQLNEISTELQNFFVVDLDSENEKNYYLYSDEEFPEFPSKLLLNLEKEIKTLENIENKNIIKYIIDPVTEKKREMTKEESIKDFNEKYQEKFFIFFCEILKGYEEYLNRDFFNEDVVSITTLFNCKKFVKSSYHNQNDHPFYLKFVEESQLFQDFIFKNMCPKNNNELMDILIVNNYLNIQKKKKNKINEENNYNKKYI